MKDKIKNVINQWDPINLFPHAPDDEYQTEINNIYSYLTLYPSCSNNILAKIIYQTFIEAFGNEIFYCSLEDCNKIAKKYYKYFQRGNAIMKIE